MSASGRLHSPRLNLSHDYELRFSVQEHLFSDRKILRMECDGQTYIHMLFVKVGSCTVDSCFTVDKQLMIVFNKYSRWMGIELAQVPNMSLYSIIYSMSLAKVFG